MIHNLAKAEGFELFGVASASTPPPALKNLPDWLDRGLNGGKDYLNRQAPRRLDPSLILPEVKSVLCFGLLYNTDKPYSIECPGQPWISRYAWGRDYHEIVGLKLKRMEQGIKEQIPQSQTLSFCDSGPVSEKVWAQAAGLGWQGKNTVLINPGLGSWLVLGVILSDLNLEPAKPEMNHCGLCRLCLDACPNGALAEPGVMDISKCRSHLTFLKGGLSPEQERSMGTSLWGCDICQDVCPFNKARKTTSDAAFQCLNANWNPDLARLADITDADYRQTYGDSYVGNLKPSLLRRNAVIVKGNLNANQL